MPRRKAFRLVFATSSESCREHMERKPCWTSTVHVPEGYHVVFESYDWRWLEKMAAMEASHPNVTETWIEYQGIFERARNEQP